MFCLHNQRDCQKNRFGNPERPVRYGSDAYFVSCVAYQNLLLQDGWSSWCRSNGSWNCSGKSSI